MKKIYFITIIFLFNIQSFCQVLDIHYQSDKCQQVANENLSLKEIRNLKTSCNKTAVNGVEREVQTIKLKVYQNINSLQDFEDLIRTRLFDRAKLQLLSMSESLGNFRNDSKNYGYIKGGMEICRRYTGNIYDFKELFNKNKKTSTSINTGNTELKKLLITAIDYLRIENDIHLLEKSLNHNKAKLKALWEYKIILMDEYPILFSINDSGDEFINYINGLVHQKSMQLKIDRSLLFDPHNENNDALWEQIIESIDLSKDIGPKRTLTNKIKHWYQSFWKRMVGLCDASTCELMKEDPHFTNNLLTIINNTDLKENIHKIACTCEIGKESDKFNPFLTAGTAASALGLGIACAVTAGAVCIPAGIACLGSAAIQFNDLVASSENKSKALTRAHKQSIVSFHHSLANTSLEDYHKKRTDYYLNALGMGLEVVGAKGAFAWRKVAVKSLAAAKGIDTFASTTKKAISFPASEGHKFWLFDLKTAKSTHMRDIKKLEGTYLAHVAKVYNKRLNLSLDEIKGFIKTSRDYSKRTYLMVRTTEGSLKEVAKSEDSIKAGVGAVMSRNSDELLPLEKATGIRLKRHPSEAIVEIVRLTSELKSPLETKAMIDSIIRIAKERGKASTVYIYTSKFHHRLYTRMGYKLDIVKEVNNGRDYILKEAN